MSKRLNDVSAGVPDAENPARTADDFANARPFKEAFPDLHEGVKRGRGPQRAPTKTLISLRLDRQAVERFKQTGPGWQTRIDAAVKEAATRL